MRITLSAGSRMPPGSNLDPVKHEGLRARWGLVASDRYALVRGLPEEVLTRHEGLELRVVFEAFTLAQPERGPHCHGGGLGTGVEADDAVRRRRTSRGRWRWRKRLTRAAAAAAASPHTSTTAAPGAARAAPQQHPPHPPACVSACVSNVPAPAAPSAPLRAASCCHLRCSHSVD